MVNRLEDGRLYDVLWQADAYARAITKSGMPITGDEVEQLFAQSQYKNAIGKLKAANLTLAKAGLPAQPMPTFAAWRAEMDVMPLA